MCLESRLTREKQVGEIIPQALDGAAIKVASDYAQSDLTRGEHGQRGVRQSAERKGGATVGNGHQGRLG